MPLEKEQFQRTLEEYKETGQEYRYRDQLMVQEFSLSMVAIAALLNVLLRQPALDPLPTLVLQIFGLLFLPLLALHLRNINQDRVAILKRRDALREALEFAPGHQNVSGKIRLSAPRYFVRFAVAVSVSWAVWCTSTWVGQVMQPSKSATPSAASSAKP